MFSIRLLILSFPLSFMELRPHFIDDLAFEHRWLFFISLLNSFSFTRYIDIYFFVLIWIFDMCNICLLIKFFSPWTGWFHCAFLSLYNFNVMHIPWPVTIYRLKYWFRDQLNQTLIRAHSQLPVRNGHSLRPTTLNIIALYNKRCVLLENTNSSMAYHKQLRWFWLCRFLCFWLCPFRFNYTSFYCLYFEHFTLWVRCFSFP